MCRTCIGKSFYKGIGAEAIHKQEDFWKLHFENLFFDPVTYICNQSEPFEQLW